MDLKIEVIKQFIERDPAVMITGLVLGILVVLISKWLYFQTKGKRDIDYALAEIEKSDKALRQVHSTLSDVYIFLNSLKEKGIK